jgi:hypothetical protein
MIMRTLLLVARNIPVLLILALTLVSPASAQDEKAVPVSTVKPVEFTEEKISLIEDNLVRDLESPIVGIVIGGAQTVREMKKAVPAHDFSKLIIPLMRIVKDEGADRAARILSALALDEIDSERGNFAIAQEGQMAKDDIFKSLCANLASARKTAKKK